MLNRWKISAEEKNGRLGNMTDSLETGAALYSTSRTVPYNTGATHAE